MASFFTVLEHLQRNRIGVDERSLRIIRAGLGAHPDFWKNFMSVMSDSDGVAELLQVPRERVSMWRSLVEEALNRVHQADDEASKLDKAQPVSVGQPSVSGEDSGKSPATDLRPTP